jgi:ABC-type uncharacterized transport system auxiliary subunit
MLLAAGNPDPSVPPVLLALCLLAFLVATLGGCLPRPNPSGRS